MIPWHSRAVTSPPPSIVRAAASEPWAFAPEDPLTTAEFCKEAKNRGIDLSEEQLPDLWRVGVLVPFIEIRNKPLHQPATSVIPEPRIPGYWEREVRLARGSGRLVDPEELGFRPQVRFWRPQPQWPAQWWNGLLYSRWQLLGLYEVRHVLDRGRWRRDGDRIRWLSPSIDQYQRDRAAEARRRAAIVVALEGRYLPVVEAQWISLGRVAPDEWAAYVRNYDPEAVLCRLGIVPDDLLRIADTWLAWLYLLDPLHRDWSELVRRAPHQTWKDLSGYALLAMDYRIASEVLLKCYEDLADRDVCPPLGERTDVFHREHGPERVSYRSQPLDANLSVLGISPHPGVVLVLEGETEEILVPLVKEYMQIPGRAELVQSVVMRGVQADLTKLAAFTSAPLIDRYQVDAWRVVKPPTRLMVAIDPDHPFDSAEGVETERQTIIKEVITVVRAQGVDPLQDDIDPLVSIRTWTERCFEFEHFTDDDLAEALLDVHRNCGGLDKPQLAAALRQQRQARQDIENVWTNWRPAHVSKTELARRLWPTMRAKLDLAAADESAPLPTVAQVLIDAYREAARRPRGHFVMRGKALTYVEDPPDAAEPQPDPTVVVDAEEPD